MTREHATDPAGSQPPAADTEEVFRLLVSTVREYAIFVLDPAGCIITWNDGAQRLKQYQPEEILGQHFSIFYEPDQVAAGRPQHNLAQAAAAGQYAEEGWRLRKDGSRFWASVLITALRDSDGELRGFAKITRDLTQTRREMERLAELEAVKSQFLRLASHELGGPLSIIRGYSSMLDEGMWGQSTPEQAKAYQVINKQARQMVWLVEQLLEASRLEDGRPGIAQGLSGPLDLREPVSEAFEEARTLAPPSHRLELDVPTTPVVVEADESSVEAIVHNLLSNAVKYSPAGGIVSCRVSADSSTGRVAVTDQGLGIDDADMETLFTRFGRIVTRTNSHIPGMGLGLYLSREMARRQGGDLTATSTSGEGSTFELSMALASSEA